MGQDELGLTEIDIYQAHEEITHKNCVTVKQLVDRTENCGLRQRKYTGRRDRGVYKKEA